MYIPDDMYERLMRCRAPVVKVALWLIGRADENGALDVSVRRLADEVGVSVREVRTAMAWCVGDTLCDTVSDTRMTHVTIRNIDKYRVVMKTSDTLSDTVNDTLKDKETEQEKDAPHTPIEKEKDKEKESLPTKTHVRKIFVPPTVEEVRAYITEKGWAIDAEQWWNFYDGKNWMIGKNKMVKWKSAVATWKSRQQYSNNNNTPQGEPGMVWRPEETDYSQGW